MWKYAEVETVTSKIKFITETKFITSFETYTQATKGKVYIVNQDGKLLKCLILKTANSKEDITNPRVRSRRPKVNPSSIEEKSSDSDELIDLIKAQKRRKAKGRNKSETKKIMSQEILTAYAQQRNDNDSNFLAVVDDNDDESKPHSSHDKHNEEDDYNNESGHGSDRDDIFDASEYDGRDNASEESIGNKANGETVDEITPPDDHNDMRQTSGAHCEQQDEDHNKHLEEERRQRLKELQRRQLQRQRDQERERREREQQKQERLQREQEQQEREHRDREQLQRTNELLVRRGFTQTQNCGICYAIQTVRGKLTRQINSLRDS